MDPLTTREKHIMNAITQLKDSDVSLGDILATLIASSGEAGTPVNANNAGAIFDINGVFVHGEKVTIEDDVYEFLADELQTKTNEANIAIDVTAESDKAARDLTVDVQPTAGDTLTIEDNTYIFVPVGTDNGDGEISIGEDLAGCQAAIVAAVNGSDDHNTAHPLVSIAAFVADVAAITSLIGGTAGNAIVTTETFTAETNIFAGVTLAGGSDCAAADVASKLIEAINANDDSLVSAEAGTGTDVNITSEVAGVIGNDIALSTDAANAEFNDGVDTVTNLYGGVDGTVAEDMKFMIDDTYLYFCLAGNSISEKNWNRSVTTSF